MKKEIDYTKTVHKKYIPFVKLLDDAWKLAERRYRLEQLGQRKRVCR